jgi:cyclase
LLLCDGVFVKTERFKNPVYIGDPVNTINLFNRFEVDEIVVLDISATPQKKNSQASIAWDILENLAAECWVPLAYGGGIQTLQDIQRIITLGVEKVVLNSILNSPQGLPLVREAANQFGSQAIVASLDVKKNWLGQLQVVTHHGTRVFKGSVIELAKSLEAAGAGELLLNSISRDGTGEGYDLEVLKRVSEAVSIPVIACGGAGTLDHLRRAVREGGASAVSAGSMFVFHGKLRGVLINFPSPADLKSLFS